MRDDKFIQGIMAKYSFGEQQQKRPTPKYRVNLPVEHAILAEIMSAGFKGDCQLDLSDWFTSIRKVVTTYTGIPDETGPFVSLWNKGFIRLTKPVNLVRHAREYTGQPATDGDFFLGVFNTVITDKGIKYLQDFRAAVAGT